jgi:sugar phosphate isomerase/epimerase
VLEISCSDYTFPLLGRQQAFALLRLLDFDLVDIGLFERSHNFRTSELRASPHQFMDGVRKDLAVAGLRPADVFLQVGTNPAEFSANDPDERVRQTARDTFIVALELCSTIACAHMTGLPGVSHGNPSRDFARAAEEAAWRLEKAAAAGVIYSIEPHLGSICANTSATHLLLSQVPGLTLTLDYGHFIFQDETNEAIHTLLPYASHLHLRGAAPNRLQTPAAESTIDLLHIVRTLASGYTGRAAMEYVWSDWHDCDRTDNLSETILLRKQIAQTEAQLNHGERQHV